MANFNVIYNIIAKEQFVTVARKVKSATDRMRSSMSKFTAKVKVATNKIGKFTKKAKKMGKVVSDLGKSLSVKLTVPIALVGGLALRQSAKLETMRISLESMTGSAEKGAAIMQKLVRFTATTPFQLEGVGKAAKTLLAFKVTQEEMIPTLRMLGDIAAGTEAPLSDIAQIFGKAKAKGKLMTEELLQLAERGIPIIDVLAKGFGKTKAQIFEMASKSQISFDIMRKALIKVTSKGGVFFKQTEKQSKTLAGVYSTLKDNASLAFAEIGNQMVKTLKLREKIVVFTEVIMRWTASFKLFADNNPLLAKMIFIILGLIAALGPLMILISSIAVPLAIAAVAFAVLGTSMTAVLLPVLAVVAAFTAGYLIGKKLVEIFSRVKESISKIGFLKTIKGFFGGDSNMNLNANTSSAATVDVNLNAPAGVIKSVKSRTRGNGKLNVGTNMIPAGT